MSKRMYKVINSCKGTNLTEQEFYLIELMAIHAYTVTAAAEEVGMSRDHANNTLRRLNKKYPGIQTRLKNLREIGDIAKNPYETREGDLPDWNWGVGRMPQTVDGSSPIVHNSIIDRVRSVF